MVVESRKTIVVEVVEWMEKEKKIIKNYHE
jgi:hypothetical protein